MVPEWPISLHRLRGSRKRLLGLTVYCDFAWLDHFPDNRVQFRNGLALARLASDECPPGRQPALLLTSRDDVRDFTIATETEFIVVVKIPEYLNSEYDAASSYYARQFDSGITQAARLAQVTPEDLDELLRHNISLEHIRRWVGDDGLHIEELIDLLAELRPNLALREVIASLRRLAEVDTDVWSKLVPLLPELLNDDSRSALLAAISSDRPGRIAVGDSLANSLISRLNDVRSAAIGYRELLDRADATETDFQVYLESNPWLIGLDYAKVRPRFAAPRGTLDFILERYDGFHDFLELKSPQDPIIDVARFSGDSPSPSGLSLSRSLANALAQSFAYRDTLTSDEQTIARQYGLSDTRNPRITILIGRARSLIPAQARVLEHLNLSMHRVEIVPYDIVGRRAEAWVTSIETLLKTGQADALDASGPLDLTMSASR